MFDEVVRPTPSADELRRVFGAFPSGVVVVAGLVDARPIGLAASSFTSVSLEPALVSFCVAHSSTTWPSLSQAPRLGVSVLSAEQEAICRILSTRGIDRFANVAWWPTTDGAVFVEGAAAWFDCVIDDQFRAGDHDIVVLRVHGFDVNRLMRPLVFHGSQFRRLAL